MTSGSGTLSPSWLLKVIQENFRSFSLLMFSLSSVLMFPAPLIPPHHFARLAELVLFLKMVCFHGLFR
jgi:hypothetical protein